MNPEPDAGPALSAETIRETIRADVYPASLVDVGDATLFLASRDGVRHVGCVGEAGLPDVEKLGEIGERPVCLSPAGAANAAALRRILPWTAPSAIGLSTSVGLGDRLGLATPGHVRAVRETSVKPFYAQQSIREMSRSGRTPQEVMDDATWGVFQESYREGFGSDADHLQTPEDVNAVAGCGFTMFTIDPGAFVQADADSLDAGALAERYEGLDYETLETDADLLAERYVGRGFALDGGGEVDFDEESFRRAAVKYADAVAHVVRMHRKIAVTIEGEFELEISVDETDSPTTPAEHYFIAAELRRMEVPWVSLAPRFVGRFEKGVDYIGDLEEFRAALAEHAAVMRTLGPYKISVHSGSDKFSVYPIIAELTDGLVHLKTAGTSYLEGLRAIASLDPGLFREILDFARGRYEQDRATYHVSAELDRVPPAEELSDGNLPGLLDDFHARQVLHVTYGSVLTADGGERFRDALFAALRTSEETYYDLLAEHLGQHVRSLI